MIMSWKLIDHRTVKLTGVLLCILFSFCRCDNEECRCDNEECRRDNKEFNDLEDAYTVCENHKNGTELFRAKFPDSNVKTVKIPMNPRRPLKTLVKPHENDGFSVILNDVLSYRERNDEYNLGLQFFDSKDEYVDDKNVVLKLIQVNRYPPRFDAYYDTLELEEEVDNSHKELLTLTTKDEDFRDSVNYSIQNLGSFNGEFQLKDASTAELFNPIKLDFETKEYYRIEIIAMDNVKKKIQGGHHTSTAVIHVNVKDIDDQPPVFRKECGMKRVQEHSIVDVFNIQAIDGDRGINNPIGYNLSDGLGQEFFNVIRDGSGGATIVVENEIDREDSRFITNPLIAFDVRADEYYDVKLTNINPNRTTLSKCNVIIEDINDNRPNFSKREYAAKVTENTQFGIPVTFLEGEFPNVTDIDEGENARFELILENNNETFTVTPTEGINNVTFLLRVNNSTALDYERSDLDMPKHLQLRIVAKEKSEGIVDASTADIKVYLEDENDNFPQFTSPQNAAISENASAGDLVFTIQATDEDSGLFGTEGIRYSLMPSHISNSFSLDWITGNLSVGTDEHGFDRETTEILYLTVEARDNRGTGNRNTTQLLIELLDANDNAPIFLFNTYRAQLMENSLNFMSALIVEAKDRDKEGTNNSEVRYAITDGDKWGRFQIDNVNGTVTLVKELDFEDNNGPPIDEHCISVCTRTYELTVTAYDLGIPQQSSNVSVYIVLQDENDNAPEFSHSDLTATINETSPKGTIVAQVNATDADISPIYKNISYSIIEGGEGNFIIDRNNGLITVAGNADLDVSSNEIKKRQFVVGASDAMMRSSSCKITINIVDINDKNPEFKKPETTEYELWENVKNISIGKFPAIDPDETACLNYSIDYSKSIALQPNLFSRVSESYDYTSIFEITNEGELLVVNHADREEMKQITLHLKVVDLNAEVNIPQEDTLTIRITILDENDNDPTFVNNHTSSGYEGSVPENVKDVSLFSILAIDIDENNTITYSIEGDEKAHKHFRLDPKSGELRVISVIDYEEDHFINFTAIATDSGVPKRNASAGVSIAIIDENDNSPQFEDEPYCNQIDEHVPKDTFVIQINASDKDSGDYGLVHFRILRLDDDDYYFAINTTTGIITVDGDLDREVQEVFKINVQAYDNPKGYAASQRTNNTKVTVLLLDINDHAPEIEAIDGCLSISEIKPVNSSIAKIIAKDEDKENTSNSEIEFFIEKEDYFGISLNGTLYVKSSLRNLHQNFTVIVMAKDKGQPPLNSTRSFCVEVYDVNTHKPEFVSPPPGDTTVIVVDENDSVRKEVYKFEAKDEDKNKETNGKVSYKLLQATSEENQENNQDFIVSPTGSLLVNEKLNKRIKPKYKIEVEACDNGVPVLCADHATLNIYIKSETDTKPHFDKQNAIVSFTEHSKPGHETQHIPKAELKEIYVENVSIPICYYIVEGDSEFFELDYNSGTLTLAKEVDREINPSLSIIVQAETGCPDSLPKLNKRQSISQPNILTVDVQIIDINDNAPIFSKKEFSGGVDTKDKAGKHILTIHATDDDEGENAVITYLIVGKIKVNEGEGLDKVSVYFTLNETTGAIFLAFQPAADTKGHFTFTVMAKDIGNLSDTAQVSIYIMRSDQQIRLIVAKDVNEITEGDISHLQDVLENATHYIVNVGDVASYSGNDKRYTGFTEVLIHLVDPKTNEVLESDKAISIIDQTYKDILGMLNPSVRLIGAPKYIEVELEQSFWKKHGYHILFGIIGLLSFIIFLVLIVYFIQTSSYKRLVKAATAKAFGPNDSALNDFSKTAVPNTNLHAVQGSNPIWNQEDEVIKQLCEKDNLSESGSANSLDVNVIEPEFDVAENNCKDNPLFSNDDETNSFEYRNDIVELVSESPAVLKGTEYTRQQSTDLGSRLDTLRIIDSDWRKRLTNGNITPIISEENFTFGSDRISESNDV